MKKIPKDIQLQVDKGNFVIAIKELSKKDNISLDEAKARIDAYEQSKQKSIESQADQPTGFGHLVGSVQTDIDAQKKSPIPLAWIRLFIILLVSAGLGVLAFQLI